MPEVIISETESFERATRRFKRKYEKAGFLSDPRRHYGKPSERKKHELDAVPRTGRRSWGSR